MKRTYLAGTIFWVLFFFLAAALPVQAGLVKLPSKENITVKIIGTRNFGQEVLFEKEVEIKSGTTAGDALGQVAEIEMAGSYIETINGIKGTQKEYWLYYINGIMANVFAHGYKMQPGDVMHWDFHDWRFYMHNPMAVLSSFPDPCIHGYNGEVAPTTVVYGEGFQELGEKLSEKLAALGVEKPAVKKGEDLTQEEKEKNNIFIVAPADHPFITELNVFYKKTELIYFDQEKIVVRDFGGKTAKEYGAGSGVLQVVQNPWNPKGSFACGGTVWAVTGLDEKGVGLAAGVLMDEHPTLENTFALVVQEDKLIRAPIGPQGEKTIALQAVKKDAVPPASGTQSESAKPPAPAEDQQAVNLETAAGGEANGVNEAGAGETGDQEEEKEETPADGAGEAAAAEADQAAGQPPGEEEKTNSAGGNYWWVAFVILAAGGASTLLLRKKPGGEIPRAK